MAESTERRVKDVEAARNVVTDLRERDQQASGFRAQSLNQLQGGLPVDPSRLRALGRGNESNHNWGSAQTDFNRAHTPFFRLLWEHPRKASVVLTPPKDNQYAGRVAEYQVCFETAYDRFIKRWGVDAVVESQAMTSDHVGWGIGCCFFDRQKSPRWTCVSRGNVRVRRGSPLSSARLGLVNLSQSYTVAQLWEKISDEKAATRAGWNVPLVKQHLAVLLKGISRSTQNTPIDPEKVQELLRDNDAAAANLTDSLECEALLVTERDGSVTYTIFAKNQPEAKPGQPKPDDGYLFEQPKFAASMREALHLIFFEVPLGERTFHGVRGQVIRNYIHARNDNRVRNRLLDALDWSMSVNLMNKGNALTEYPIRNLGRVNVVQQSLEQVPIVGNIQPALAVSQWLDAQRASVNGAFREAQQQVAEAATARQGTIVASMGSEMRQDQAALFLVQMSAVYDEQGRRLRAKGSADEDAKEFQRYLREQGVPDEVIHDWEAEFWCAASPGGVTPWERQATQQKWLGLIGHPAVNDTEVLRDIAASDFGPYRASRYVLTQGDPAQAAEAQAAKNEGAFMGMGVEQAVLPQHDHAVHATQHMTDLGNLVGQFQQSGQTTPQQAMTAGMIAMHAAAHLDYLKANKNAQETYQRLNGPFRQMAGLVAPMQRAAQQQAQLQPAG